jgi:hypothetical protein
LNIPFPPYEIFLPLLAGKPLRSFKSIQDGDLFPVKKTGRQFKCGMPVAECEVKKEFRIPHSELGNALASGPGNA